MPTSGWRRAAWSRSMSDGKRGSRRYARRSRRAADEEYAGRQMAALADLETQIFARAAIAPDAITEFLCEKYFPVLERFGLV